MGMCKIPKGKRLGDKFKSGSQWYVVAKKPGGQSGRYARKINAPAAGSDARGGVTIPSGKRRGDVFKKDGKYYLVSAMPGGRKGNYARRISAETAKAKASPSGRRKANLKTLRKAMDGNVNTVTIPKGKRSGMSFSSGGKTFIVRGKGKNRYALEVAVKGVVKAKPRRKKKSS